MIDYSLFSVVAARVRYIDPFCEFDDFIIMTDNEDDDWKHILSTCAEVKDDVEVKEYGVAVNVVYDDGSTTEVLGYFDDDGHWKFGDNGNTKNDHYQISYRSIRSREEDALEFNKRYHRYDPALVDGMLKLFNENTKATFYERKYGGRLYFGVQVGNDKVYEGCVKL